MPLGVMVVQVVPPSVERSNPVFPGAKYTLPWWSHTIRAQLVGAGAGQKIQVAPCRCF